VIDFLDGFMEIGVEYEDWGKTFLNKMREDGENPLTNNELNNRETLSVWMCKQHNLVNRDLEKTLFDCSYESLKQRWGPL
jgi:hypothetical protein